MLACGGTYRDDCYWFTGAVANGYAPCDGSHVGCCGLEAGVAPWDRPRDRNVSVVIAPVSSGPRPAITCSAPSAHLGVLCQSPASPARLVGHAARGSGTVTAQLWSFDELFGHRITVDIARAADGSLSARVCRAPWTDVAPDWCPALTTEVCASSGTVTLAAFPDADGDVSLDAHVVLDDVTLDMRI